MLIRTGRERVRRLLLSSAAAALTHAARGTWPLADASRSFGTVAARASRDTTKRLTWAIL